MIRKASLFDFNLFLLFLLINLTVYSQVSTTSNLTTEQVDKIKQNEVLYEQWVKSLSEPGVKIENDSMKFSPVTRRILSDKNFRDSIYKDEYTFEHLKESLVKMDLKLAFWEMINLYPQNKNQILSYLLAYDKQLPVEEILTASFYTYAFFDPKFSRIVDNKLDVFDPTGFEDKLRITKEIIANIRNARILEK